MTTMKWLLLGSLISGPLLAATPAPTVQRDYQGFTVWLDCREHAAFKFRYNAGHDMGDYPREDTFRLDPQVPYECHRRHNITYQDNQRIHQEVAQLIGATLE